MKVTIDEKAKTMTIVVDLETPRPSGSGKTMLVASETQKGVANYKDNPVTVALNAYYPKSQ